MNEPVPLEWVTSFAQTNQALVQHLATALLSSGGGHGADFQSYAQAGAGSTGLPATNERGVGQRHARRHIQ